MIGVALSFLIGLMEVSHLDTALNVAALAVGAALPLLVIALVIASTRLPPGQHTVFANVLNLAGWLVGEGLGSLCIFTGFVAMLWHLNEAAVWVSLGAVALAVLLMLIVFLGVAWKIASVDEKAKKAGESPEEARRQTASSPDLWKKTTLRKTPARRSKGTGLAFLASRHPARADVSSAVAASRRRRP